MSPSRLCLAFCLVIAGCDLGDKGDQPSDFGAAAVARLVVRAEAVCRDAGRPEIAECADLPRSRTGARDAAVAAQDTYQTFQNGCYATLGMSKCEALVEQAYKEAKSR